MYHFVNFKRNKSHKREISKILNKENFGNLMDILNEIFKIRAGFIPGFSAIILSIVIILLCIALIIIKISGKEKAKTKPVCSVILLERLRNVSEFVRTMNLPIATILVLPPLNPWLLGIPEKYTNCFLKELKHIASIKGNALVLSFLFANYNSFFIIKAFFVLDITMNGIDIVGDVFDIMPEKSNTEVVCVTHIQMMLFSQADIIRPSKKPIVIVVVRKLYIILHKRKV